MPQIDARDLDHSPEMRAFFSKVHDLLVHRFGKAPSVARALVDRFFSIEVDPLERAFVMHDDPEHVAEDLARL